MLKNKIAFIGCSNIKFMPYLNGYLEWIGKENLEVIYWDRFNLAENTSFRSHVYNDSKIGHRRGIKDYFKFVRFVKKTLSAEKYDFIIISTLQLYFFMQFFVPKNYKNRFILDVRDYHMLYKFMSKNNLSNSAKYIVVSSSMYKDLFPKNENCLVHHNIGDVSLLKTNSNLNNHLINISSIGATRDVEANKILINSFKESEKFQLFFHGEGVANNELINHIKNENINNVIFTGSYEPSEMNRFYKDAAFINVVRFNDSFNNYSALPNRLYQAAVYGKPLITFEGTYLAEVIQKYGLGVVLNTRKSVDSQIETYINTFDINIYENNRRNFLNNVLLENRLCEKAIKDVFIKK